MFLLTALIDFVGSLVSLWLGLYLLGRGFTGRITLRAVAVLLALAVFFLGAYLNLYFLIPGIGKMRALMLTISLPTWIDLSEHLLSATARQQARWSIRLCYAISCFNALLLLADRGDTFPDGSGTALLAGRGGLAPLYMLYCTLMMLIFAWVLFGTRSSADRGAGARARYVLIASVFSADLTGYFTIYATLAPLVSRVIEDGLLFTTVVLTTVSMARHQTMVERRTILQEAPVSALVVFGLSALYAWIAWQLWHSPILVILAALLAILTHAVYDLAREFVDRLRRQSESETRQQLRQLERDMHGKSVPAERLQDAIKRLCQVLDASGGFIARPGGQAPGQIIVASYHSVAVGSELRLPPGPGGDGVYEPPAGLFPAAAWLAPAWDAELQAGVIGLGPSRTRARYSEDDLDLLAEAADRIARILRLERPITEGAERVPENLADVRLREESLRLESDELITTLATNPDPGFVAQVEQSLRNLSDFISLGQNPLAERLGLAGGTNIETGKALREQLVRAVEMLRPGPSRPEEPLPREWHSYAVLHDAYIQGVPNREIMARLYVSESTFNRTRRKALRGVARFLLEEGHEPV